MVTKTGTYTLRVSALEAGTSNLLTDEAVDTFTLDGDPFVEISTDKGVYSTAGDTISISLDASVPYDVVADYYVVLFSPDGSFWSPTGFFDAPWVANLAVPMFASISLDAGFEFSAVAFTASLPSEAPFDALGDYTIFTALAEPGKSVARQRGVWRRRGVGGGLDRQVRDRRAPVRGPRVGLRGSGGAVAAGQGRQNPQPRKKSPGAEHRHGQKILRWATRVCGTSNWHGPQATND